MLQVDGCLCLARSWWKLLEVQPDSSCASINTGQRRLSFIPKAFQPQQNWSTPKDSVRAGNRMEMPRRIVIFFLTSCLKTWLRVALLMPTWPNRWLADTPMEGDSPTTCLLNVDHRRLAAIAPSAHPLPSQHRYRAFPKIPVFHVAGRNDRLVKMEWQQATIDHLLGLLVPMTGTSKAMGWESFRLLGVRVERGTFC